MSLIPLSRDVAETIVVDASPTSAIGKAHGAEASSVRLLLLVMSQACRMPEGDDDEQMQRELHRRWHEISDDVVYDDLDVDNDNLRVAMGNAGLSTLKDAQKRLTRMLVTLRGEAVEYGQRMPTNLQMLRPDRSRARTGDSSAIWGVERSILAAASAGMATAVWLDPAVLRRFRCRYTPVLYVRCLAWLAQGVTTLDVPADDLQHAIGVHGIARASQVERTVLVPAMRELRDVAGILLGSRVVRNRRGEVTGLRLSVQAVDESVRRSRDEERDRERAAASAARKRARQARPRRSKRPPKPAVAPASTPATPGKLAALRAASRRLQE